MNSTDPATLGSGNMLSSFAAIGFNSDSRNLIAGKRLSRGVAVRVGRGGTRVDRSVLYPLKSPVRQASGGTEAKNVWPVRMRVP